MEYFKVTGTCEYTQPSTEFDIDSIVVRKSITRIVRAESAIKARDQVVAECRVWIETPLVTHATLADIEREELKKWNAQAPLSGFQLAVVRGEMAAAE